MMNYLVMAATAYFAMGAIDYIYRISQSIYYDIKNVKLNRKWKKERALREKEMNSALADLDLTTTPVAL